VIDQDWMMGTARLDPDAAPSLTLEVDLEGRGDGSVESWPWIDCGDTCTAGYAAGTKVSLTALPVTGSVLAFWKGCGVVSHGRCNVKMTADDRVAAVFAPVDGVAFMAPVGGETVVAAEGTYPVAWASAARTSSAAATRIYRSIDGGAHWKLVARLEGNPGGYDWTPPAADRTLPAVRLRVVLVNRAGATLASASSRIFKVKP
jgi:hypothetical protein